MMRGVLVTSTAIGLLAGEALACAFHTYAPDPTMVDHLLGSDHVVLARPAAEDPSRYVAVTALTGGLADVAIPVPVPAELGADLAADPETRVLFARDEAYGPWQELAVIDDAMAEVLDFVWARIPDWRLGGDDERLAYFGGLAGHPSAEVRSLSLKELDKADYSLLRRTPIDSDAGEILAGLDDEAEADYRMIRILMLGLSDERGLEPVLRDGVAAHLDLGDPALGAFATALIEYAGPDAAQEIAATHLIDASLPVDSRILLTQALAMHAQAGDADVQTAARAAVSAALRADPTLAPIVAEQFGMRGEWSQAGVLGELLQSKVLRSPLDIIMVSQYVALAADGMETGN